MKDLTKVQIEFLKILETFMHEKEYRFPDGFTQIEELFKISVEHSMTAAVYEQIQAEEIMSQDTYGEIANAFRDCTLQEVVLQMRKSEGFLRIYDKLEKNGIRPLVIKGIICRNLYSKPDYRISGDEDMLISREQFTQCDEFLLAEGFQRESIGNDNLPYEIPYVNPSCGLCIELHLDLFPEESGAYGHLNREFSEAYDTCIKEMMQGRTVWTLSPTLHMLYLICHSLKHFLHSGFGIRQVCDMVMMAEHYGEEIDWDYIQSRLKELRMDGFWNGLLEIGENYLDFSIEKAKYPLQHQEMDIDCKNLLLDLFASGIYGHSSDQRSHSSNITLTAAKNGEKDMKASLKASLFPGIKYMKTGFPWLEKYPWLLPISWGIRILRYAKLFFGTKKEEKSSMEIGMERVELLREYHIID